MDLKTLDHGVHGSICSAHQLSGVWPWHHASRAIERCQLVQRRVQSEVENVAGVEPAAEQVVQRRERRRVAKLGEQLSVALFIERGHRAGLIEHL